MAISIMTIYLCSFILVAGINYINPRVLPFVHFTRKEPEPEQGEYLSAFKLRKLQFIFNCLLIVLAFFSFSYVLQHIIIITYLHQMLLLLSFLLLLASVVMVFANIAFIVSWARTRFLGPNPQCDFKDIVHFHNG